MAVRLRLVAEELGPTFVKLAQVASTRRDLLPDDLIEELKKLQDSVPALPWADVERAIVDGLGRDLDAVYESVDRAPLAAASVGQVHRARLRADAGEGSAEPLDVVVKVQRPGIRKTILRDLELLSGLAALVERAMPEVAVHQPKAVVDQFARTLEAELDYGLEAENARRFARNFEGHPGVRFPRIYADASSRSILTQELLPGGRINEAVRAGGYDGLAVARQVVAVLIKQVFEDGFFHADPHPGNVFLTGSRDAPELGLIDLGMVGRLSPDLRDRTMDLLIAAAQRDPEEVADALYAIGVPTRKVDLRAYRSYAAGLAEKYLVGSLKDLELAPMFRDLVAGATKFGIQIPPDFLLVGKALMTLEGVGREIAPDLDFFTEAKPHLVRLVARRYAPGKVAMRAARGLGKLGTNAYEIPNQVHEVLEDLRHGRLTLGTQLPADRAAIDRHGRRVSTALLVAAFVLGGAMLLEGPARGVVAVVLFALAGLVLAGHLVTGRGRPPPEP